MPLLHDPTALEALRQSAAIDGGGELPESPPRKLAGYRAPALTSTNHRVSLVPLTSKRLPNHRTPPTYFRSLN
ncbi:MAG: hypothetical protein V3R83_04720, partial [Gammaproteobacteria bacterium]